MASWSWSAAVGSRATSPPSTTAKAERRRRRRGVVVAAALAIGAADLPSAWARSLAGFAPTPALGAMWPIRGDGALLGASGWDVVRRLGPPQVAWREAGAELWTFAIKRCVLHLFLHADDGASPLDFVVAHWELRFKRGSAPECSAMRRRLDALDADAARRSAQDARPA